MSGDSLASVPDGSNPEFFIDLSKVRELPDEELRVFICGLHNVTLVQMRQILDTINMDDGSRAVDSPLDANENLHNAISHYLWIKNSDNGMVTEEDFFQFISDKGSVLFVGQLQNTRKRLEEIMNQ